jgi:predicted AAA+ superfamily ATPase
MKPWREVTVPHTDVLEGTFQQSEFAADLTAVQAGKATREYQEPAAFYQRTFITEGMRLLLIQVMQRLNGGGGEPVVQLQTAFGGGKTHGMLAVYHLATRTCPLDDLEGIPPLLDAAGLMDVPRARVAVIDGHAHAPGQAWQHGRRRVCTLWGELAWQLGGEEAFALVAEADATGTSPGKGTLTTLLSAYAPCVILIDELVAYVRQFPDGQPLSGGTFDSNLSFVQALTEACKLVPNVMLLASLPESEVEAGSQRGVIALRALEKTFGRVQALWKPVATEEAFEIVRRRLFEPVRNPKEREVVCRAFADAYVAEGMRLPSETQESRYLDRLLRAYPIHPEVFDRLYEDWTTIEGFQRTRGVLKLMAKVIYRLWKDTNTDLMILPGGLPLYDGGTRNELNYYLPGGWDAVIERDIDGDRAETTELETKEPRFGAVNAARRVARTIYLGSAPSSVATKPGIRGLDRARILLGCLQPGQAHSTYTDALSRLADRLHYLNASGEKSQDTTRFWFDTRANLRREMEDRKKRFDDKGEVRTKLAEVLKKMANSVTFDGFHVFTSHADVPDDSSLRLVLLAPDHFYSREEPRPAFDALADYLRYNGLKPRYRINRLLFVAPDHGAMVRLRDGIRTALAWQSIVDDVKDGRLNIDQIQRKQAEKEAQIAEEVLPRSARECYKWLLCPAQYVATDPKHTMEVFQLNTSGGSFGSEVDRVCRENELVITTWSPVHLHAKLRELYWKPAKPYVGALAFWEDTLRYLYLPRLKNRSVLEQAIVKGADTHDFFGAAYGETDGVYTGFKLGDANVQLDDTLLLIEPGTAQYYAGQLAAAAAGGKKTPDTGDGGNTGGTPGGKGTEPAPGGGTTTGGQTGGTTGGAGGSGSRGGVDKAHTFIGTVDVNAATAKMRLVEIADEIISRLAGDPQAKVSVTVEINAEFPAGVSDSVKRAVAENAASLGFRNRTWE